MSELQTDTITWRDNVVTHRLDAFPEIEVTTYRGQTVRAYRDRPESLWKLFAAGAEASPEEAAFVFPETGVRRTYRELAERVHRVAAGLRDRGLTAGDRIALISGSRPEVIEVILASARIGAVTIPLNTGHSASEIEGMFDTAAPDLAVVESRSLDTLAGTGFETSGRRVIRIGDSDASGSYTDLLRHDEVSLDVAVPSPDDLCMIMHTSGTTGQPKGVPIEQFHCTNAVLNNVYVHGIDDGTTVLIPSPLFHVTGLVCGLFVAFAIGGTSVVLREYSPERFLRAVETERVEYCMGVPTHLILAAEEVDQRDHDTSSLVKFAYGGAPMPGEVLPTIRNAFPEIRLYHSYGKTENFAGIAAMLPDQYVDEHPNSVGMPSPVTEIAVVDEDRNRLPPGETGELAMRGPFVAERYLNAPGGSDEGFDDGWHYTGDVGVISDEGLIELRGRKGNMMIRGGENIYPAEIENTLLANEDVREAGVSSFPDDVLGERVLAAVVPKSGARLTEEELRRTCAATLADHKVPDIFRIVDELPRNQNGKLDRGQLVPEPLQFGIKFRG
ncbi:class I adenylate-forming enzyme family protein [Halobellus ruber]|uniref:Acyl--CoA ligase n=1 Tax=Halobellus ruber TaxID=2761102 RepID=A0A7J9SH02_9EURY|nr:class I adenylate-forming enzyme family protein [Halobellus ruber]MBB6645998.1 acyl--CoA ligase [Halobellus ruber]